MKWQGCKPLPHLCPEHRKERRQYHTNELLLHRLLESGFGLFRFFIGHLFLLRCRLFPFLCRLYRTFGADRCFIRLYLGRIGCSLGGLRILQRLVRFRIDHFLLRLHFLEVTGCCAPDHQGRENKHHRDQEQAFLHLSSPPLCSVFLVGKMARIFSQYIPRTKKARAVIHFLIGSITIPSISRSIFRRFAASLASLPSLNGPAKTRSLSLLST